jgi:hypothetical protein
MGKATRDRGVQVSAPPLQMPNANSIAEDVTSKALDFCARKLGVDGPKAAAVCLSRRDHNAVDYCHYSIADQVGAALGSLDENVQAVYMFDYDATAEDICFDESPFTPLVHLLVLVERKTEALNALVATLDRALAKSYARVVGPEGLQHLLDVQTVDTEDVAQRIGYGALLSSLHHRPLKVWNRA